MANGSNLSNTQTERLHKFAHDIRNRLAGLHEAVKHLGAAGDPDQREILEYGEQQFFKALREVENLLDDFEVERGDQSFESTRVQLADVVSEAAGGLKHRFDGKHQQVRLKLDPLLEVKGDRHFITESVSVLLSNASKFSPHDTPIEVVMKKRGNEAELCVIDQGVGLTAEDLNNIFTRYAWLGSRSTNGEAQGRSSLARAHQWAKGMGGSLTAASEGEGKGCAFTLRLPLA
jgi:K+-sensing histidine kinase KdpD